MENKILFTTATGLAEKIKLEKPYCKELDAAIVLGNRDTYVGVTGINVTNNDVVDVPADVEAIMNMKRSGERRVVGLAVINLKDMSFKVPSEAAVELMFKMSIENDSCLVCLGENESKTLSEFRLGTNSDLMMDGFDASPEEHLSTDANTISGINVENDSPFYEETEIIVPPAETLSSISDNNGELGDEIPAAAPELTPEELLKQAKKRKSIAKSNFLFRKRHN